MRYKKGLVEIIQLEEAGRCDACSRAVKKPTEVKKAGKTVGKYGPVCVKPIAEKVIKVNEASKFGLVLPGIDFIDYFKRPNVKDIREFEGVEPNGEKRVHVLEKLIRLKNGQYLNIQKEIELIPYIDNWRKKGDFIQVYLPHKEKINKKRLTPKEASKKYVGQNYLAYAGLIYFNKTDNRNRIFSLMSLIEGKKISYLCKQKGIEENIEIESDQGPNKIMMVPSTTEKGEYYPVKLKNLAVEEKDKYSKAFEFDFTSISGDALYNNLPHSNANMRRGARYRHPPIRPDKFAMAALDYLMAREDNDILVDPRPVIPSNLACLMENRLLTRAVHGSELLDGHEIEAQLWMATRHPAIGYKKMFE